MIKTETVPNVIFTPKRVEEAELFGFDFKRILPEGDSILTAQVIPTLIEGRGVTAGMTSLDTPIIQGTWVKQVIRGGTKESTYHFRFIANTLNGLVLIGIGELKVID